MPQAPRGTALFDELEAFFSSCSVDPVLRHTSVVQRHGGQIHVALSRWFPIAIPAHLHVCVWPGYLSTDLYLPVCLSIYRYLSAYLNLRCSLLQGLPTLPPNLTRSLLSYSSTTGCWE